MPIDNSQTRGFGTPSTRDLMDTVKREVMLELNCHSVGTIQSFDAVKQTAKVTINYKISLRKFNAKTKQYEVETKSYPVLADCPVVILSGTTGQLTFPIAAGDECLVLFNDRAIDTWWKTGNVAELPSRRAHAFADALVLVGVRSQAKKLTDYDTANVRLRNGTSEVLLGEKAKLSKGTAMVEVGTKIKIDNGSNLKTALTTAITTICTQVSLAFGPVPGPGTTGTTPNAAALAAIAALPATLNALIEAVLE